MSIKEGIVLFVIFGLFWGSMMWMIHAVNEYHRRKDVCVATIGEVEWRALNAECRVYDKAPSCDEFVYEVYCKPQLEKS